MFKLVLNELNSLNKPSKIVTYSILTVSFVFSIIALYIGINKSILTLDTYYTAFELCKSASLLFLEAITIGVLMNLTQKRKEKK